MKPAGRSPWRIREKALKGARLRKWKDITGDTFMMTYGDGIADVNIGELLAFHKAHGKMATVTGINIASRFGELKIDGDSVEKFSEKPQDGEGFINGGFFVFDRKILSYLTKDDSCDLEIGPLEQIAKEGQLMCYTSTRASGPVWIPCEIWNISIKYGMKVKPDGKSGSNTTAAVSIFIPHP